MRFRRIRNDVSARFTGQYVRKSRKTFDYFEKNIGDYRNNAQRLFGCRGIVVPVISAPNTGRLGSTDVFAIHFTGCGAWLANFYYKYAKISQNAKFLKNRLIPFMKEVALFYEDFLKYTATGLEISPSALPMRVADSYKITDRPVIAKTARWILLYVRIYLQILSRRAYLAMSRAILTCGKSL